MSAAAATQLKTATGVLEGFSKDSIGALLGKSAANLRKYVTGKSAFQIQKAYAEDFKKDPESSSTKPEDLGPILVKVKIGQDDPVDYTISIENAKEDLSKYLSIAEGNLIKHAKNCTVKRSPEDRFKNKIVFVAELSHEGMIGKFIGSGGKNIKMLTAKIKEALGVQTAFVTMKPDTEEMGRQPWKNKFIRISTNPDNHYGVNIIVSANLPEDLFKDYRKTLQLLTPLVHEAVMNLEPKDESNELCADDFLLGGGSTTYCPPSPEYSPETPDNDGW